jgi:hypothetical protein
VLRLTSPIMLDLTRVRCTSLETIETMVGTVHLNYMVRTRGLEVAVMALVDAKLREVSQVKDMVTNIYHHFDAVGKQWAIYALKLGWKVMVAQIQFVSYSDKSLQWQRNPSPRALASFDQSLGTPNQGAAFRPLLGLTPASCLNLPLRAGRNKPLHRSD